MLTPSDVTYWKDVAAIIQSGATITTLILGIITAYYKFLKGRVFHSRMEIIVTASMLNASQQFIKVVAIVKNTGSAMIHFDLANSVLRVYAAKIEANEFTEQVSWEKLAALNFTDQHKWIEPNEMIEVNWLVDIPTTQSSTAYRLELSVAGQKTIWKADCITSSETRLDSLASQR